MKIRALLILSITTMASLVLILGTPAVAQVEATKHGNQALTYSSDEIARAMDTINKDAFCGYCAEILAETGSRDASPALERHFSRQTDPIDKLKIAQALVVLKDPDPKYWDYLYKQASVAVNSDAPEPAVYNASGSVDLAATPAQAFTAWRQSKRLSQEDAYMLVGIEYPAAISMLGMTEDSRAIPILRKALDSPVYLVQLQAAQSLAQLHDLESVPKIIALCHVDPAAVAHDLAEALVYFDDVEAQKTVDAYLPREEARIAREARAAGKTALF